MFGELLEIPWRWQIVYSKEDGTLAVLPVPINFLYAINLFIYESLSSHCFSETGFEFESSWKLLFDVDSREPISCSIPSVLYEDIEAIAKGIVENDNPVETKPYVDSKRLEELVPEKYWRFPELDPEGKRLEAERIKYHWSSIACYDGLEITEKARQEFVGILNRDAG